ncbi:HD-GYP domain-containing protein [Gorillibacterium massiliense]|uniref:HD-GYP domain-containing protein n=1 Tax=Gorillibacterium massiliense TaxID=1280390 RepID=UPI0005935049|nr:HD-GYP domain-containing protein [Gorillibacterium massiliense]
MKNLLGRKVKFDIVNDRGLVIVPARFVLDRDHLRLLEQHGIDYSGIALMSDQEPTVYQSLVEVATERTKELFNQIKTTKKVPLLEIKNELIPIVQQTSENPDVYQLFETVKAKDEYLHKHSIGVGVLATLIGKWMKLNEGEISLISLAAVMHDVGKLMIPDDILLKPDKLTKSEYEEMKRHTLYGYEILRNTVGISPRVALVALQHHERSSGGGYPLKLKERKLDILSRIVAIADVFHAMTSRRPYHEALPYHEVVTSMRDGMFGELDPVILKVFLDNMNRHLIGQRVMLTDGRWGEVVFLNPHDDTHPLIKIGETFLDLNRDRDIHIQEVIV